MTAGGAIATNENAPRRLRAEATRHRLVEASLRVFAAKGFAGSTTKDIAREAGVTDGLIYHYFRSKEALLWAGVKMHNMAPQLAELAEKLPAAGDLERGLFHVLSRLFEMLSEQKELVVTFFAESQRNRELQGGLLSLIDDGVAALTGALEKRTAVAPELLRASVRNWLMAAVMHFLTRDRFSSDAVERKRYIRLSARQLSRALR